MGNTFLDEKIESMANLVKVQCSNGNWNYDPYMHGMANGMILMLAVLDGEEPKFLDAPKKWLRYNTPPDYEPEVANG